MRSKIKVKGLYLGKLTHVNVKDGFITFDKNKVPVLVRETINGRFKNVLTKEKYELVSLKSKNDEMVITSLNPVISDQKRITYSDAETLSRSGSYIHMEARRKVIK